MYDFENKDHKKLLGEDLCIYINVRINACAYEYVYHFETKDYQEYTGHT